MISNVFERREHPLVLFLLMCAIVLAVGGVIAELASWKLLAGFFGVFAVLLFVFWVLSFGFMAVIKRVST